VQRCVVRAPKGAERSGECISCPVLRRVDLVKFPGYLEKPPAPLSAEDRQKYEKQNECVTKIIAIFDKKDYDDEKDNKQIVDLMSEVRDSTCIEHVLTSQMQSYGTPPAEIMGPLPPGFDPASEDGCNIA